MGKDKKSLLTAAVSNHPARPDVTLLTLKGSFVSETVHEFERVFLDLLKEKRFKIVVDLKDVDFVSSAGWGVFIGEIRRIRKNKGDLFLVGLSGNVFDVYDLLEFDKIIKAYKDVDAAVCGGFGGM